jgi:hypothetical protein
VLFIRHLSLGSFLLALALVVAALGLRPARAQPAAGAAGAAALDAALVALNGVPASQCADNGRTPPTGKDTCVSATPAALAGATSGLVSVQVSVSAEAGPGLAMIGLGTDGAWGLWFAAPAAYVPYPLPSAARVCAVGGLNVRATPGTGAAVVGGLMDGAVVTVNGFSLLQPGSWSVAGEGTIGSGWYQLAESGWVSGAYLVVADADCGAALAR